MFEDTFAILESLRARTRQLPWDFSGEDAPHECNYPSAAFHGLHGMRKNAEGEQSFSLNFAGGMTVINQEKTHKDFCLA